MQLLKSDLNPYSKVFLVKGKEGNPASRMASKTSSRFFRAISVSFLASLVWLASFLLFAFVFSGRCSFVTRSLVLFLCLLLHVLLRNHFFNLFLCVVVTSRARFAQIFIVSFYFSLCIRALPSHNLVFL